MAQKASKSQEMSQSDDDGTVPLSHAELCALSASGCRRSVLQPSVPRFFPSLECLSPHKLWRA